jgi:hypothetical protein
LYDRNTMLAAADLLNERLIPLFHERGLGPQAAADRPRNRGLVERREYVL